MEKNPEQRDPEADNREQPNDGAEGETTQPVDGPGGDEEGQGATSQGEPG
jgi:hypothetical protein